MSKFDELLSRPLPSALQAKETNVNESFDDTIVADDTVLADTENDVPVIDPEPIPEETPVATAITDDDVVTDLSPEESQGVDDTMNAVATPILIKSELSEEEIKEFTESVDCDIAEAEGFLTERTIVKFDKNARKAQLYEVAVAACAKEKKDPLYRKLETVYKMERVLKAKLRKKYHAPAQKKVKEYLARAKKSKSGILAKIANKITGK